MDKSRKNIIVSFVKSFHYPISMLDSRYPKEDAKSRAAVDMQTEMNEIIKNEFRPIGNDFFEMEIAEELPFVIRETFKEQYQGKRGVLRERVILKKSTQSMALYMLEKKYGPIDINQTPNIFQPITEVNKQPTLLPEIEEEYMKLYEEFHNVLKKCKE